MFLYLIPNLKPAEFQKDPAGILLTSRLEHLIGELDGAAISEFLGRDGVPAGVLIVPRPAWRLESGVIVAAKSFDPPQFDLSCQLWAPGAETGCWIGIELDKEFGPTDLLRRNYVGGVPVPDASGRNWLIPIARSSDRMRSTLPVNYDFDLSGRAIPKPKGDYDELWEISGWIDDALSADGELDYPALATLMVPVLAINHRVSAMELSMWLNHGGWPVLDDRTIALMAMIVTNSKLLEQANEAKKNAPADSVPNGTSSIGGDGAARRGAGIGLVGQR